MVRFVHLICAILAANSVHGQTSCINKLADQLEAGCPTVTQFCRSLIAPSNAASTTVTYTTYSYVYLGGTVTRKKAYGSAYVQNTTTITTTPSTLTSQGGLSSTTVAQCNSLATCGAITMEPEGPISIACSCLLIPRTLSTTTVYLHKRVTAHLRYRTRTLDPATITMTTYPVTTRTVPIVTAYACSTIAPPPQGCGNKDHQYALYDLTEQDYSNPPSQWNLNYYKSKVPIENGTSLLLGFIAYDSAPAGVHDPHPFVCQDKLYINDRAYLYAPQTGTYTINIPAFSQAAFLWIGSAAYSGYNVSNAFLSATAAGDISQGGPSGQIHLVQGNYYPIRIAYRCIANAYDFDLFMNIVRPDGHFLIGEYSKNGYYDYYVIVYGSYSDDVVGVRSDYIVQYGCGVDQAKAPPYPDWGSET